MQYELYLFMFHKIHKTLHFHMYLNKQYASFLSFVTTLQACRKFLAEQLILSHQGGAHYPHAVLSYGPSRIFKPCDGPELYFVQPLSPVSTYAHM